MSLSFEETFITDQVAGTIPWSAGWTPSSSRTLDPVLGTSSIVSSLLSMTGSTAIQVVLTYNYPVPTDLSQTNELTFENVVYTNSATQNMQVTIHNNGNFVAIISITNGSTSASLSPLSSASDSLSFTFVLNDPGATVTIDNIVGPFICVAHDSVISCQEGERKIQELQRGDLVKTSSGYSKVARVIRECLREQSLLEAVTVEKGALGDGLPKLKTIFCANHYLVYRGKRRLARSLVAFPGVCFVKAKAKDILPCDDHGNYYLYDIQYDHEADYFVNGLLSQSRSPYAKASPLEEHLYWEKENYNKVLVNNTLTQEPEITFYYLLPSGEEVESLVLIKPRLSA
nr:hemolysin [Cedratvirus plubellavi]